jgi:hypothetical protein
MPFIHRACFRWCASIVGIIVCWLLYAPLQAQADPLDLASDILGSDPNVGDITAFYFNTEYSYTSGPTGTLTVSPDNLYDSTVLQYQDGLQTYDQYDGNTSAVSPAFAFSISAQLNNSNGDLVSGTFVMGGDDTLNGNSYDTAYDGVLLTGNLTGFGFPDPTSETTGLALEFTFQVTGGLLTEPGAPWYNVSTAETDISYFDTSAAAFAAGWPGQSWGNSAGDIWSSQADTWPTALAPTPEPSTFVLLAIGLLPLAWRLRRRGH